MRIFIVLKQKYEDQEGLNQVQWSETGQWYLMPWRMKLIKLRENTERQRPNRWV
jgi:hypothetical protein